MEKSSKRKKVGQKGKAKEVQEKIRKSEEMEMEEESGGVAEGVLKGVGEIVPGLGGLMKGLEKSPAFKERLKRIDQEIERKMKEGPLRRTGDRSPHIESSFPTRTLAPEEKPSFQRKVKKPPAPPLKPKEPVVDLFDEGDHLRIITELPGVAERDIETSLEEDTLTIRINRAGWKPEHEVALPCAPKGKLEKSFRSGFLEIRVGKD